MTIENRQVNIGVLALQGDFEAHGKMLSSIEGVAVQEVRTTDDLTQVDALLLPGGESTTIAKLLDRSGLMTAVRERLAAGMPAFGTCAGLILLAKSIVDRPNQPTIGALKVTVDRNAFGRQVNSFEADINFDAAPLFDGTVRGVFIRAPYVTQAEPGVDILARYEDRIVAVRQGSILGIAFHPELTSDDRVHRYFINLVSESLENH